MSAEQLQQIYASLREQEQQALLYFAEFLKENSDPVEQEKQQPLDTPRPEEEKVIYALRRLTKTYPMLKHEKLLKQGADLMSDHFVTGREAVEVIDELEVIFRDHYQRYLEE